MRSNFIDNIQVHHEWEPFLTPEIIDILKNIEKDIKKADFTPSVEKVLRFMEMPLTDVKIIILGQDPYPQPGVATGRAFEVGTLKSWNDPFKNISLKNILRALYKAYFGVAIKYSDLKKKFDNEFPVLSPDKLFKHWEKQGVLLLNTSFTCAIHQPGSHKKQWEEFSSRLLNFININRDDITWFLWGNHALEATREITLKNSLYSQHPMMCYDKEGRDTDFLYGKINCFAQFVEEIDWTGFQLKPGTPSGTLF